jgi:hypothetical protein
VNAFHAGAGAAFLTAALIAGTHGAMAQAQTPGTPGGNGSAPASPAVGPPSAEARIQVRQPEPMERASAARL